MDKHRKYKVTCSKCGHTYSARLRQSFEIGEDIGNLADLNDVTCPKCLNEDIHEHIMEAIDYKNGAIIHFDPDGRRDFIEEMTDKIKITPEIGARFTNIRACVNYNDFLEKVYTFESNLNDKVIEVLKQKIVNENNFKNIASVTMLYYKNGKMQVLVEFIRRYRKDVYIDVTKDDYDQIVKDYFNGNPEVVYDKDLGEIQYYQLVNNNYFVNSMYGKTVYFHLPKLVTDEEFIRNRWVDIAFVKFENGETGIYETDAKVDNGDLVNVEFSGEQHIATVICRTKTTLKYVKDNNIKEIKEVLKDKINEDEISLLRYLGFTNGVIGYKDLDLTKKELAMYKAGTIFKVNDYPYFKINNESTNKNTKIIVYSQYMDYGTYNEYEYYHDDDGYYKVLSTQVINGQNYIYLLHLPHDYYYMYDSSVIDNLDKLELDIVMNLDKEMKDEPKNSNEKFEEMKESFKNDLNSKVGIIDGELNTTIIPKLILKTE